MKHQNQVRTDGSGKGAAVQSGKPRKEIRPFLAEPGGAGAGVQALSLLNFPESVENGVLKAKHERKETLLEFMRCAALTRLAQHERPADEILCLLDFTFPQRERFTEQARLRNVPPLELLKEAVRNALETPQRLDALWETMEEVNQYVTECRTLLHLYGQMYFEAVEYPGDKMVADGLASMGGCSGDSLSNAVDIAWQHVRSLGERSKATEAKAKMAAAKGGAS